MHCRSKVFINEFKRSEGWRGVLQDNLVKMSNGNDEVEVKVNKEELKIGGKGQVNIYLEREGQRAKLSLKCVGKIREGDKIWLLDKEGEKEFILGERNNFEGAVVEVNIEKENKERREIFIQEKSNVLEKKNPRFNLILGIMVLALLGGGTVFGYQKRNEDEQKSEFVKIQKDYEEKKKAIESIRAINLETALQLTEEAESILKNSKNAEKKYGTEIEGMRQEIAQIKSSLGGGGSDYEIIYDTSIIGEKLNFEKMATKDGLLYLWSPSSGRIEKIDIELKAKEDLISDEKVKEWQGIFCGGEKCYGYNKSSIYEIKKQEIVEDKIDDFENVTEIEGWNSLIYYIDNSEMEIKKIVGEEGQNWLKNDSKLEEEASGISIDSSIWILGKSGRIYHYNRGVKENFVMSYQPKTEIVRTMRTNEKVDFLAYVADEKSVIICGKDGKILARYNFDNTKIKDIAVESKNQAVLVLAENGKIYRIKIK